MASTYSNLKIQLMATGENSTTWGNVTNINMGTAIEEAITGSADVAFSSANVTLTLTDTNTSQTARNLRLNLTGTATTGYNLIVPSIEKVYIVNNGTDGTITIKNATGTGVAVPTGKTIWVFNNGTDIVSVVTHLTSLTLATPLATSSGGTGSNSTTYCNLTTNVVGALPAANGGTGLTTFTAANNAIYSANASTLVAGTLPITAGGTGATSAAAARTALGAAGSGVNTDITALDQDVTVTATGTIAANTIGYRGLPQSTNTTLALADAGKHIYTASNVTIPANSGTAFPVGTTIVIANSGSATLTISITTDTLRQAGTTSTGTRTLLAYGVATVVKVTSTVWYISGNVT
jgi:hypothetical protein